VKKNFLAHWFIITTFVGLYLAVSIISTIHVIDFFRLSNPEWLAISLAISFEVGAAASLAALIVLEKLNRGLVWILFIILTLFQMMGNTYYAFVHLQNFQGWVELFGLVEEEVIYQKRILSIISGSILPLVALGFIKSLVDYLRPTEDDDKIGNPEPVAKKTVKKIQEKPIAAEPVIEESETVEEEAVAEEPETIVKEVVAEEPENVEEEAVAEEPENVEEEAVAEEPETVEEEAVAEEPKEEKKRLI